jgi:hypothetical protein
MAEAAAPHADVFVSAGLSVHFIAELHQAADALLASLGTRLQSRGDVKRATEGLQAKLSEGRKIVRVLDIFVRKALKDDPALVASWALVSRVRKTPVRSQVAGPVPTPTPAPTGSTGAPAVAGVPASVITAA